MQQFSNKEAAGGACDPRNWVQKLWDPAGSAGANIFPLRASLSQKEGFVFASLAIT